MRGWPGSACQLAADLPAAAGAGLAEVRINRLKEGAFYAVAVVEGLGGSARRRSTRTRTIPNGLRAGDVRGGTPASRGACKAQLTSGRARRGSLEGLDRERGEAPGGRDPGGR